MDKDQLWRQILKELQIQISSASFKTWFAGASVLDWDQKCLVVGCTNNFKKEWLEKNYKKKLQDILTKTIGREDGKIVFQIIQTEKIAPNTENVNMGPLFGDSETGQSSVSHDNRNLAGLHPTHTFETFIVGHSNNVAYAASCAVAKNPGSSYNPLFVYGGVGIGKTHLMHAVGNAVHKTWPDKKIFYCSAEKFTNDFIDSLSNKRTRDFRDKYRRLDVWLVDDIQFIAAREATQEEFFHTFNELYMSGKQIMISSDRKPQEIPKLEDRLSSRFMGGLMVDIGQPDFEMRVAILKAKALKEGLLLSDEATNQIAALVATNTRELEGALFKIITFSRTLNCPIDTSLIRRVLGEKEEVKNHNLQPKSVLAAVNRYFNTKNADIIGIKRGKELVFPRQIAMYLLRKELGVPLVKIGELLGNRDHTTVMHGVDKIEKSFALDSRVQEALSAIKQSLRVAD